MSRISIICGSNRKKSNSSIIGLYLFENEKIKDFNKSYFSLIDLNESFSLKEMYESSNESFEQLKRELIEESDKFIFIIPEYNGSFPGILKLFIDTVPPVYWKDKKAGLIGLSAGVQGGSLALSQFTNVLNYLKCSVYHHKPKLSLIDTKIQDRELVDEFEKEKIALFLQGFLKF